MNDLRFAWRQLFKHPGFVIAAALTLALGIGANAAVFSVIDAVLLRPLPYGQAGRLVRLWSAYPTRSETHGTTSPQDLEDWQRQSRKIESMGAWAAFRIGGLVLTRDGVPTELNTEYVTPGFFSTLGTSAAHGRTLAPADHTDGRNRVMVLSDGAWRRLFGGDPKVVGRSVELSGDSYTVVGVMPRQFAFPASDIDAWAPLSLIPETGIPRQRQVRFLSVVGRLAPGATVTSAQAEMSGIADNLSKAYPKSNAELTAVTVQSLRDVLVGPVRPAMLAIFGSVALVLLIGCVNVTGLILARSDGRSREMAVRTALGATRGALARQVLVESSVLAALGGGFGLLLGAWCMRLLVTAAPVGIPRLGQITLSGRMLAFTALISVAVTLLVGVLPALRSASPDFRKALNEAGRGGSSGRGSGRLRGALVAGEVALVAVLAVGAGLLVRSYASVRGVDPGFRTRGLLTLSLSAGGHDYQTFLEQALTRVRDIPGVESAALVRPLPLGPDTFDGELFKFDLSGASAPAGKQQPQAALRFVSPGFFRTMGVPLISGRDFTDRDDADAPPVVVVSRTTADRYWGRNSPVGSRIRVGGTDVEVVGVVGDIKQTSLEESIEPAIYTPFAQSGRRGMSFVIRTDKPVAVLGAAEKALWALRPDQPIRNVASIESLIQTATAGRRYSMALLTTFAFLALFLAAVGVYGIVAYSVSRRMREIGIRVALGARPGRVARLVFARSVALVAVGGVVGLGLAAVGSGLLRGFLFGVGRFDPWVYSGSAAVLLIVAAIASALPAHRASRVDPVSVLREE